MLVSVLLYKIMRFDGGYNLYSRSTFGTSPKGRFLVNGTSPKGDLGLDIWTQKLAGTRPIWEKIGKRD